MQFLASRSTPTLRVGIKLPPYIDNQQFQPLISTLLATSTNIFMQSGFYSPRKQAHLIESEHRISFLTSSNTLGGSLVFEDQVVRREGGDHQGGSFALPGSGFGGLAGQAIHQISLGYVSLSQAVCLHDLQYRSFSRFKLPWIEMSELCTTTYKRRPIPL